VARLRMILIACVCVAMAAVGLAGEEQYSGAQSDWRRQLVDELATDPVAAVARARADFPAAAGALDVVADWVDRDQLGFDWARCRTVIAEIGATLGDDGRSLRERASQLRRERVSADDPQWAELYLDCCQARRVQRLEPHAGQLRRVVFTQHYDLGGSHYAYTEGQSDAQNERHFTPGSALCLLEVEQGDARVRTLLEDAGGVIRDPDTSHDGARILFSWKKSLDEDDYHLYEMTVSDGAVRQITSGRGQADYEGVYLPDGNILFNSTRCVQTVDCWWTEVSNLFTCDGDGRFLRQLSFDQVHTNYPTVTHDGRVIYTRWDYSDRGQLFPQGLFQMNPDGTGQTEVYGNNSWFPTSVLHARAIPGTSKIVCTFTGHHTLQKGWLGILDPRMGRQENQGAQLIAPVRETEAVREDYYGQSGDQFQYPYPLSETEFLAAICPEGRERFAIYWVSIDGHRELLAADDAISCNQPIPLAVRPLPPARPQLADYRQATSTLFLQDVYRGPGLAGVERGTVKALRVIALEFRAAGIGYNTNTGPAGDSDVSTPVSIHGSWDVKRVLGTARVYDDGSACFTVPARTPIYFQALDAKGQMVQSMRSWVSLQPGERMSCVGCHEHKNTAPPVTPPSLALNEPPQTLAPFHGPERGFSFIREIQPILDRRCVRCHYLDEEPRYGEYDAVVSLATQAVHDKQSSPGSAAVEPAFSLRGTQTLEPMTERKWSDAYRALADRRIVNWINIQSAPPMLAPYTAGASQSRLVRMLEEGSHYGIQLTQAELDRFIVWIDLLVPYCGDYTEAMNEEVVPRYREFLDKRRRWHAQESQNIEAFLRERGMQPRMTGKDAYPTR